MKDRISDSTKITMMVGQLKRRRSNPMKNVDDNNNEQVDKENKRERDVSEIDWSGLGDVVMKRYFARLKKDGLLPPYLEKYLVEEDEK